MTTKNPKAVGKKPAFPAHSQPGMSIAQAAAFTISGNILAGPYGATILEAADRKTVMEEAADRAIDLYEVVQQRLDLRGYA